MFVIKRLGQMTKGGIAGFLAVLALAGVAVFFWGARTINVTPAQCVTCHAELTEMWQRSQGHPAEKVTCHQCHAPHAALPESPNLIAFVRDQLIPEKYLATDERIAARCEECHGEVRASGTGLGAVQAKGALRSALSAALAGAPEVRALVVPTGALGAEDVVRGEALGASAVRYLRDREWVGAARGVAGDRWQAVLDSLREDLGAVAAVQVPAAPEAEARLAPALAELRGAAQALLADLPRGPLPPRGEELRIVSGVLRPLEAAEARPEDAVTPVLPAPARALAEGVLFALSSVAEGLEAEDGLPYDGVGLDGERVAALQRTLDELAQYLRDAEEAKLSAAAAGSLEAAVGWLPVVESEDGLRLELSVEPVAPRPGEEGFVALDLVELVGAALDAFDELGRGLEERKVVQANHKVHLVAARDERGELLGLGCLDCHRSIAHDKNRLETNRATMAGCFAGQCHQADRNKDNCRRCHYQHLVEPGQEVL
ncbi:MAG: hypothetical protein SCH98_00980 [Deferrisomatales bacterium]|nr:hypothetical protein [Deferrisomatales bacterium]